MISDVVIFSIFIVVIVYNSSVKGVEQGQESLECHTPLLSMYLVINGTFRFFYRVPSSTSTQDPCSVFLDGRQCKLSDLL